MKEAITALATAGVLNIVGKTTMAEKIIIDATARIKSAADLLEELEKKLPQEDAE